MMSQNQINVVRFFAFVNGDGSDGMPTPAMIQTKLGQYDEAGLQRLVRTPIAPVEHWLQMLMGRSVKRGLLPFFVNDMSYE